MKNRTVLMTCILIIIFTNIAGAAITSPYDNEILTEDFFVNVLTNENVTVVDGKLVGFSWFSLEKISGTAWTYKLNISSYPNGDQLLTVRYTDPNGTYYYTPLNIRLQAPTPTPVEVLKNFTVIGLSPAGSYSNKSKIWVSVVDSISNMPVQASITLNNPDPLALWNTIDGLTKMDFSPYQNDTYRVKVTAAGYNQKTFFINLYEPLLDFTVSGLRSVYLGGENITFTTTPLGNATLRYYNNTVISEVSANTTDFNINTSKLASGDYKISVEKPGYAIWHGELTVVRPSATPTPAPTPAQATIASLDSLVEMNINGERKNLTVGQLKDWYVLDYSRRAQATPTPPPTPPPVPTIQASPQVTQQPPQGDSGGYAWLLLVIAGGNVAVIIYLLWKGTQQQAPQESAGSTGAVGSITTPPPEGESNNRKIKCDKCDWEILVDRSTSDEVIKAILSAHESDPAAHNIKKIKKETENKTKQGSAGE